MNFSPLSAISPLDGRYRSKLEALAPYFSEYALIRYRLLVEIEYFIALRETSLPGHEPLTDAQAERMRDFYRNFSEQDAYRVKEIERTTNHDVKAVEYILKEWIDRQNDASYTASREFVHFGLTSQDINNTATPLLLKEAIHQEYLPKLDGVIHQLRSYADAWKAIPMLARTHGQPASPTTLGKEIAVFVARLQNQRNELASLPVTAKFGGATGNFNAHIIAYPEIDWEGFGEKFVNETLGLLRSRPTTQIEHYDGLARIFDCMRRINVIMTDLCQDIWIYISQDYFKQKVKKGEVGSSAMPHKVNPIDFENAEGNVGISTALFEYLSRKLPVSRLQRDLTDSTVLRNLGVAVGHAFLALGSLERGLGKLVVNQGKIQADLDAQWAVLAEAIQTILRRENYPNPYEALKALTRGNDGINQEVLLAFIKDLDVSDSVKAELRTLRPEGYIGNAISAIGLL
ncbi:MAG: adenylosuccinate lyase [Bacteroidia bacterium]